MKKWMRYLMLAAMIVLGAFTFTQSASADWQTSGGYTFYYKANGNVRTGWYKEGKNTYYFRKKAENGAPRGSMVTGFYKISGSTYYFNSKGVRQKGWQRISGKIYYFSKSGKMISGRRKKIDGNYFLFNDKGELQIGWIEYNGKLYYFKKTGKLGRIGMGLTGWQTNSKSKKTYYFTSKGYVTTGWKTLDGKKYYFNSKGVMQTGWLTKNGNTYYLNSSGVMQTGWQTISGKRYYFNSNGVMAKNTTVNGIKIDANGVAEVNANVLIVAGHGQGDPGATSTIGGTYYQESNLTREFATLIYNQLKSADAPVTVTMYDQNYDWYKANGYYSTGSYTGPLITWSDYDFILEVHFNATATASKDLSGDGSYKGMGVYVHSSSSSTTVDRAILSSVKSETGFKIWGGGTGIFYDSSLRNPRLAESNGIPYGLLETCFIDDKDDMTFYNNNKNKMAKAVADGIVEGLGLK